MTAKLLKIGQVRKPKPRRLLGEALESGSFNIPARGY